MAFFSLKTELFWFLLTAHVIFNDATASLWRRTTLSVENEDRSSFSPYVNHAMRSKHSQLNAFEPGDTAAAFKVATLDGQFSYTPGSQQGPLIIHAFTNKSAFLEWMWISESSLAGLVDDLPKSTRVLFLSYDDSAFADAVWMRNQIDSTAVHRKKYVMSRFHFCPVPVSALGNWIPSVLYSWGCAGHNCGFSQAVFSSKGWKMPVTVKRLDARYDWLMGHWGHRSYRLADASDGCRPSSSVAGTVAWVSEGGCSFFHKVQNMAKSNASGILVYALVGNPIREMNCEGDECATSLSIPAAMVHIEPCVVQALRLEQVINVSFQNTPSPNFFFAIDRQGALSEMGWFIYPSFRFMNWQAQWFDFYEGLQTKLRLPAHVVSVFDKVVMHGEKGAVASVDLPTNMLNFDTLELDAHLSCPGERDSTCAPWDHTVQLLVCCEPSSPYCNIELGRWITAFRRGIGHWLTDVSPLIPLLNAGTCNFTMKTVPWAMPWVTSLNLRFSSRNQTDKPYPFQVMQLYSGGTFDKNYNKRLQPVKFSVPVSTKKVELYAVITGHGSDENGCGEFCVTSHSFLINGVINNRTFDSAGTALGCTLQVQYGAVPNEHGTWLYGRGGWCDGQQVDPWRTDVTAQMDMTRYGPNTLVYLGLYNGQDPNPAQTPGYIIMSSFLVFYK